VNTAAPDTAAAPVTPARPRPVARPGLKNRARLLLRPWWPATGEVLVSLVTALGFTYWGLSVGNSPVTRVGQVSGLSDLQFRLALLLLVLLAAVGWATVRGGERVRSLAVRLGAAAVAGLSTGFLGAGQVFALRGTPWPINGPYGDNNRILAWAEEVLHTGSMHAFYPPAVPYVLGFAAKAGILGGQPAFGLKWLFIAFVALTGPAAYLAWRSCLSPLPALAVGLLPALQQTLPHKPYSPFVLVVLVPLIAKLLMWLRAAPRFSTRGLVARGTFLGVLFGLLFLIYSGWHLWSLPGALVAVLLCFPWRDRPARALLFLGSTLTGFLLVAGVYLRVLLSATGTRDQWCSGYTLTEPAYIGTTPLSGRAWDEPGEYPGFGEFAGLHTYAVLALIGLGVAVAIGLRQVVVIAPLACFGSAWLIRFWLAGHMEADQQVQLFPRTMMQIQVTLTALAVLACVLAARKLAPYVRAQAGAAADARHRGFTAVGALLALALAGGMIGSFFSNQYLPTLPQEKLAGTLAWQAHQFRKPDGSCPKYAQHHKCRDYPQRTVIKDAPPVDKMVCEYPWRKETSDGSIETLLTQP
jgi:galactan 5-O-arabinofuranosyltransferase